MVDRAQATNELGPCTVERGPRIDILIKWWCFVGPPPQMSKLVSYVPFEASAFIFETAIKKNV